MTQATPPPRGMQLEMLSASPNRRFREGVTGERCANLWGSVRWCGLVRVFSVGAGTGWCAEPADRAVKQQTPPEALEWLWKGYPIGGVPGAR